MELTQVFILAAVMFIGGLILMGKAQWLNFKGDDVAEPAGDHGHDAVAIKSLPGSIVLLAVVAIAGGFFVKALTLLSGG